MVVEFLEKGLLLVLGSNDNIQKKKRNYTRILIGILSLNLDTIIFQKKYLNTWAWFFIASNFLTSIAWMPIIRSQTHIISCSYSSLSTWFATRTPFTPHTIHRTWFFDTVLTVSSLTFFAAKKGRLFNVSSLIQGCWLQSLFELVQL